MKLILEIMKKHTLNILSVMICAGILVLSNWQLSLAQEKERVKSVSAASAVSIEDAGLDLLYREPDSIFGSIHQYTLTDLNDFAGSVVCHQDLSTEAMVTEHVDYVRDDVEPDIPEVTEEPAEEVEVNYEPEEVYAGSVIDEHGSVYIPQATIKIVDMGENNAAFTVFKSGRTLPYDVDAFIDNVDETEFFYMLVESENGTQSSLARRLTADCVLNMKAAPNYPDTIKGVILKNGVFEVVSKGSIFTVTPKESTKQCVDTELLTQIDYSVMYFRTDHYHEFGVPYAHVDDCWFSKPSADGSDQWLSDEDLERLTASENEDTK